MKKVLTFNNTATFNHEFQSFIYNSDLSRLWLCARGVYEFCGLHNTSFKRQFKLTVHNKRFKHSMKIDIRSIMGNVIFNRRKGIYVGHSISNWIEKYYSKDKSLYVRIDWT